MAGTNNFLQFNPTEFNQESDVAYAADSLRAGGIPHNAIIPSPLLNKFCYQSSTMVAALAQMLANKGFNVSDADFPTLYTLLANILTTADLTGLRLIQNIAADLNTFNHTGTTTEDVIYSLLIPANSLHSAGELRIKVSGVIANQVASPSSTMRVRFGGQVAMSWFIFPADAANFYIDLKIFNTNNPNLQRTSGVRNSLSGSVVLGPASILTANTTINQTLQVTIQSASTGDTQQFTEFTVDRVNFS